MSEYTTCKNCGRSTGSTRKRYCSDRCRTAGYRARIRRRAEAGAVQTWLDKKGGYYKAVRQVSRPAAAVLQRLAWSSVVYLGGGYAKLNYASMDQAARAVLVGMGIETVTDAYYICGECGQTTFFAADECPFCGSTSEPIASHLAEEKA